MAIPSGPGSEVLGGFGVNALDNAYYSISTKASGSDKNFGLLHIITILSITVVNVNTSDTATLEADINDGSNVFNFISSLATSLPKGETFVWNDKIVLPSDHIMRFWSSNTTSGCDWYVSYIDQNWA